MRLQKVNRVQQLKKSGLVSLHRGTERFDQLGGLENLKAFCLRAMRRLGAAEEGVLRAYQVRPDGSARDSVMFSVLRGEWPGVRAGLLARLPGDSTRSGEGRTS